MRFRLSDLLLFALIFVFIAAFPVDLIPVDLTYQLLIHIGLRSLLIIYYIYIITKYRIKIFGVANVRNFLICLPFFIVCGSNFTASLLFGGFDGIHYTTIELVLFIVYSLFVAVSEEIVFRLFIHNNIVVSSSLKRILASAGIFALMHLLNVVNVRTTSALINVLVQTVYTFGLGLLLGFMYEYSHSLIGCVILHFFFNVFNRDLYVYFGGWAPPINFYLTAVGFAVVVAIYTVLIYIFYFQRNDRYYRQ